MQCFRSLLKLRKFQRFLERFKAKLDPEALYTHEILRKFSFPCFKVFMRLGFAAFSESFEDARRDVETLANVFSSFNGIYAKFKPRIVSFLIISSFDPKRYRQKKIPLYFTN
jgi:hypothetical protein